MNPILLAFGSFLGLSVFSVALSGYANRALKLDGWKARASSWVAALVLVLFGYFAGIGYVAKAEDFTLIHAFAEWIGIGLSANGIFTIEKVKSGLAGIGAAQPSVAKRIEEKSAST